MNSFDYVRPASIAEAVAAASQPGSAYLAGGTNLLDLMKGGIARLAFLDQANRTHDLSRRAEAALEAVMRDEGRLHRMKRVALRRTLDGADHGTVMADREREAGIDPTSIDQDGAGAALPAIAALLGSGQMELLAQKIEQRDARILQGDLAYHAVHCQRNR